MQENNSLTFSAVCLVLTLSIVAGGIMSSHYENEVMKFSYKLQKTVQEFQIMVLRGALKEKQNDTKELKAKLHLQETEKTIARLKTQFKEAIELAQWYKDKLGTKKNDN